MLPTTISPRNVRKKFFPHLNQPSRAAWHVCVDAAFGEKLNAQQLALYQQCTGRTQVPLGKVDELWLVVGRRGGKSETTAFLAVYLACFKKYAFSKGEKGVGMLLAADRKQARVIMRYVSALLHSHPLLEKMIVAETQQSVTLDNDIIIEVHTSNFRSVRGYTIAFVICDEIAFWKDENSANPDTEVLDALRPALGTTGGMLIALSSPYAERGELWNTFNEHHGKEGPDHDDVLVWKAATRVMNPTYSQKIIDRAYRRDPAAADTEFGANFRRDVVALFAPQAIQMCVPPGVTERPPQPGLTYRAFVDPAGGSGKDEMTLGIAHTEHGREVLDLVKFVKPPFKPADTVKDFCEVIKAYRCNTVTGDRYAGEWPRERFKENGIHYELAEKTKSEIYKELLPLVNDRTADLLDDKKLLAQLGTLERRTGRSGRDTIDHPPGGHDDVVNAGAGALVAGSGAPQYRARVV